MSEKRKTDFDKDLLFNIKYGRNNEAKSMLNKNLIKEFHGYGTLLHYAALYGNQMIARHLIKLGSDIDALGRDGTTPLMVAIQLKRTATINVLLKAKANIDIVVADGESALQMALDQYGAESKVAEIFVRKLRAEARTTEGLAERLIAAGCNMCHTARFRDTSLMKCMLERGIDINSKGSRETTALHAAAELDDLNLAKWLISNGADVNALDKDGSSALISSAWKGNKDMVNILLEQGADANCKERICDDTPLFAVIHNMRHEDDEKLVECVELLLQYGAIPQNSTTDRHTIFDLVLDWSCDKTIKMLVSHQAMLEMLGASITESIMQCTIARHQSKMAKFENFHKLCQQVLTISMFNKLSLLDLLNENKTNMRLLVRKETFVSEVEKVCSEHKLSESYSYYYNTVMKRIAKATRVVKLEDNAVPVICKIFDGNYNQCYNFARKVVGYLDERDLEQLVEVL